MFVALACDRKVSKSCSRPNSKDSDDIGQTHQGRYVSFHRVVTFHADAIRDIMSPHSGVLATFGIEYISAGPYEHSYKW